MDELLIGDQQPEVFETNSDQDPNAIQYNNDAFTYSVAPAQKVDMETQTEPMAYPSAEMECQTEDLPTRVGITQTTVIELVEEDCQTEAPTLHSREI